uniref:NADH-ubiquinone oxidoreductase chain 5 n=1 Tax=Hirudinaria manillensis TaxID=1348078 RepID=X2C9M1_HIRMN|nr:NADH dehydrogenase subunit 5 [Hirudinaria manillensis]AGL34582.1 NADH dehydrogenase subunit 5 [Hirudinaria manillensis]
MFSLKQNAFTAKKKPSPSKGFWNFPKTWPLAPERNPLHPLKKKSSLDLPPEILISKTLSPWTNAPSPCVEYESQKSSLRMSSRKWYYPENSARSEMGKPLSFPVTHRKVPETMSLTVAQLGHFLCGMPSKGCHKNSLDNTLQEISKSLGAGMITAITNRIGDVLLLISIVLCVGQCHWYSVDMWFINLYENKTQVMLILGAGMTKSAQIPFSSWLPAAMAAPTPVSALVHSSTLVTAGVFLLIRFYDFLYCFNYFNTVLLLVSIMTMVMSGLAASVEWDMKKIIALSTLSQLGLMMMTLSLNMLDLAYLHMVSHALFKALLFICAGNLIMNFFHSQDLRWMGNLSLQMPLTSLSILLSSMAMGGFPFLSSFYTKDQILELLIYNSWSVSVVVLMYVSIGITVFYSLRFCINLLWMVPMYCVLVSLNENKNVAVPMFIMGLMTVCMSCILLWIYPNFYTLVHIDKLVMLMPLFIIFVGFLFALLWSVMALDVEFPTQLMNNYMWFMVPLSTQVILGFMPNTKLCLELLDQSWLEYLGGYGMHEFLNWMYSYFIKFMNWELMWMLVKMVLFTCLMILVGLS